MPKNQQTKLKISSAKGRPMLYWVGKKPLDYVKGYPTQVLEIFDPLKQIKEVESPAEIQPPRVDNWQNLLFYGDNKDVLATLLEQGFRGKIDLIYIDPPFMSGADYVRKVELRGLKETRTTVDDKEWEWEHLIKAKYELDISEKKTTIAVKIIDMLGEEIIVSKEV